MRRAATSHLLDLGHRRLAYISGPPRNILDRERRAGFLAALDRAKLPADRAIFCTGDFTFQSGAIAADELLRLPPAKRPTAVFAANDEMAIGLIKRLGERGVAVPRDISVVGFDAIDFSDFCEPALTTVRQPRSEIGCDGRAPFDRGHERRRPGAARANSPAGRTCHQRHDCAASQQGLMENL